MSREFHVGAQVVCIDDRYWPGEYGDQLEKGRIYTIRRIEPSFPFLEEDCKTRIKEAAVWLEGARRIYPDINVGDPRDAPWGVRRFRPVRKTDISVFTAMLKPVREDA